MNRRRRIVRWTPLRKAELVQAVTAGRLTREAVCAEHAISPEEFESWARRYALDGPAGLALSRAQEPAIRRAR